MDSSNKAALYIRVSTEEQAAEGQSVDAQIEVLSQYCRLYNIEVYNVYKDLGISGKDTRNRPGLNRLLHDAAKGCFNQVLVWKISRLSRSLKDLLVIIDQLEKSNIVFSSYSEKFDTSSPVGKMTLQLLGSIAEFERNTIIDNVKLGLQEYARKGGKTGTVLGYDSCNKQLNINPQEAEIIKTIYNLYTQESLSMSQVASKLNEIGYRTKRGKSFSKDTISVILNNPVYVGINRHRIGSAEEYQTKGSHQPIISVEQWSTAQSFIKRNKSMRPARDRSTNFLLSGKLICPYCKMKMYSFASTPLNKTYRYYRCNACGTMCKADRIEKAVLEQFLKLLFDDKTIEAVLNYANMFEYDCTLQLNTEIVNRERRNITRLLDNYVLLLQHEDFKNSKIVLTKIKELEQKLTALDSKKSLFVSKNSASSTILKEDYIQVINEIFIQEDKSAIKKLLDSAIKEIEISHSKKLEQIVLKFAL